MHESKPHAMFFMPKFVCADKRSLQGIAITSGLTSEGHINHELTVSAILMLSSSWYVAARRGA